MTSTSDEKKLFSAIMERLDRIESKIDELTYPSEQSFRGDFIERVEEAEKRVEAGKGLRFKDMDNFFESVEE